MCAKSRTSIALALALSFDGNLISCRSILQILCLVEKAITISHKSLLIQSGMVLLRHAPSSCFNVFTTIVRHFLTTSSRSTIIYWSWVCLSLFPQVKLSTFVLSTPV